MSFPIIVSDLDGTLLDHFSYQFDPAIPAIKRINERNIPLILNSSKTATEIQSLRRKLDNTSPYVVENGAGIYLPDQPEDKLISFGLERKHILQVLEQLKHEYQFRFSGFNEMSVDVLINHTGLSQEQAEAAMQRDFTEPLLWQGNDEQLQQFNDLLASTGITTVQGGRFLSVSGEVDKGAAMLWLKHYYVEQHGNNVTMIALGDSDNDKPMLEAADIAILVRSPAHSLPELKRQDAIVTNDFGPGGWNDSMMTLLDSL